MAGQGYNFGRIVRQMNLKPKYLSGRHAKVIYPGFPHEAYNVKGQITPWSMLRMLESSRDITYSKTSQGEEVFLDMDKLCQNHTLFTVYTSTQISPKLYDQSLCKSPLEIDSQLVSVGKTSFRTKNSVFIEGLSEPVIENFAQAVLIKSVTRKPSSLPDWWVEKYTKDLEDGGSVRPSRHVVPVNGVLHTYTTKVSASDVGALWHLNWSNYLKYSFNAFVDYALSKHGHKTIHRAIRNTKQFSLTYLQEAKLDDTLEIMLWKGPGKTNLFYFQFFNDSRVICESQMEFYPLNLEMHLAQEEKSSVLS